MSRHEIATVLDTAMTAFTNGRADIALPLAFAGLNLGRKALLRRNGGRPCSTWLRHIPCAQPCSKIR